MSTIYTVQQGDCISSIAMENGFFWQTLWNLPDNATLKENRQDPNVLLADDQVTIPDLRVKQVSKSDGAQYTFMRKGVPEKLRLLLLDADQKPRGGLPYRIVIDGLSKTGKTSSKGEIVESIPPDAQEAQLILDGDTANALTLNLGHLNPVTTTSGVKSRLANLGFFTGDIDDNWDDAATQALNAFQKANGLPATANVDDGTRSQLLNSHGH